MDFLKIPFKLINSSINLRNSRKEKVRMMENVKEQRDEVQNKENLDLIDRIASHNPETKLQIEERLREINKYLNNLKAQGHKGLISPESREVVRGYILTDKDLCKSRILKTRDDIKEVNNNQYQIIYKNEESNTDSDFEIEPNKPFYQDSEEFKNKKKLTKFLNKSKKVYINPDMSFIPYKADDKFYILVVNNVLENIEVYQLNSLNYLNKQHNVYYIIEANRDDRVKDLNSFKNYIIRTCQKYANYNRTQLYEVYKSVGDFESDKISKQYK